MRIVPYGHKTAIFCTFNGLDLQGSRCITPCKSVNISETILEKHTVTIIP